MNLHDQSLRKFDQINDLPSDISRVLPLATRAFSLDILRNRHKDLRKAIQGLTGKQTVSATLPDCGVGTEIPYNDMEAGRIENRFYQLGIIDVGGFKDQRPVLLYSDGGVIPAKPAPALL
jgi:hypothetical protein